jgi:hypothetical protein
VYALSTTLGRLTQTVPTAPSSGSHASELNSHTNHQVDAEVKPEDEGDEPVPTNESIQKTLTVTENTPTISKNTPVATVNDSTDRKLAATSSSKTPSGLRRYQFDDSRFTRNPVLKLRTGTGREPLKINTLSIRVTFESYNSLFKPRLPSHKLKPLKKPIPMTLTDVPPPLRQSFTSFNFGPSRVEPVQYGMKDDGRINGGWCYTELCTDQICPLGEECPYSHCPPDRETCLWLLQVDTRSGPFDDPLARDFLLRCLEHYWQKYYRFGLCPILSPLQRGSLMSCVPFSMKPIELGFERPDNIFEGEKCEDIIKEWQFLNDLHKTITKTFNPTAPPRSGIQNNTQGSGTESKRVVASETDGTGQLWKKYKRAMYVENAYDT